MVPNDPEANAFKVNFADLQNHAATFHTFKLITEDIKANGAHTTSTD